MILLVEDDRVTRTLLADHLCAAGHEVLAAANSQQALVFLKSTHTIRLVIVDFISPDVDGLHWVEYLRDQLPDTRVVLISDCLPEKAGEAILARFKAGTKYLPKPVRPTALELTVQTLLSDQLTLGVDGNGRYVRR